MKRRTWPRILLMLVAVLIIVYYLGPRPRVPVYDPILPVVPQEAGQLEHFIAAKEALHKLKPENEAHIVWYDSVPRKTKFSVVYLHGFSASQKEGDPVHLDFARRYGCNLYLSRLDGHGIDTSDPLATMSADGLWADAKQALAIGRALGEKVILMTTSTGGTLALKLAATYPNDIFAIINMSPNVKINDNLVFLTNNPWGLQISRFVRKSNFNDAKDPDPVRGKYWYNRYRLEAVGELESLVETTMNQNTFRKVKLPVLNLYYYKDAAHQDKTVRVSAILTMEKQLGTADSLKEAIAIPEAGAHVLGSSLTSKDVPGVERAIDAFAERKLGLVVKE